MARLNKKHPMKGSLVVQFRPAEFAYDRKDKAFYLRDLTGKRRYGPFNAVQDVKRLGFEFILDGGKRAESGIEKVAP